MSVDEAGNLQVRLVAPVSAVPTTEDPEADGRQAITVTEQMPVSWQELNGHREIVDSHYVIHADGSISLGVGAYDRAHPLTIDPAISYSTYFGGSEEDYGEDIAVDSEGNIYITGSTWSQDFPIAGDPYKSCLNEYNLDVFVSKFDPTGTTLLWSTYLGGPNDSWDLSWEDSYGVAVDSSGNVYVTGASDGTDYPIVNGYDTNGGGSFLSKLNQTGSSLSYSTYLGGNGSGVGLALAVDNSGNAYIAGSTSTSSGNWQVYPANVYRSPVAGSGDAYVVRIDTTASGAQSLIYSTYVGGSYGERARGIALDGVGNVYITGFSNSSDFPTTPGVIQPTRGGGADAFAFKLNAAATQLVFSTFLGGTARDQGQGIAYGNDGAVYINGWTESSDFPATLGALQEQNAGEFDAFVAKLNSDASVLVYATYLGGSRDEWGNVDELRGRDIAVDEDGYAYIVGRTNSWDFPLVNPVQPRIGDPDPDPYFRDAFVAKLNLTGSALVYSTYLGGSDRDEAVGIALGEADYAYVLGTTRSHAFPVTPDAFQPTITGWEDEVFLTVISGTANVPLTDELMGAGSLSQHRTTCCTDQPINVVTGNFWHTFTDLSVPGQGAPIQFSRTYNSQASADNGPLGYGWTHNYNMYVSMDQQSGDYKVHEENGSVAPFNADFSHSLRVMATLTNTSGPFIFTRTHSEERYFFYPLDNSPIAGKLYQIIDSNGLITTLSYQDGLLRSVTDSVNRTLTFTYTNRLITSVGDPGGRAVSFGYDPNNPSHLTSASDVEGRVTSFSYDANHHMLTVTDPADRALTNAYDIASRVISQTDFLSNTLLLEYATNSTTVTSDSGLVTVFNHGSNMLTLETASASSQQVASSYGYQIGTTWVGSELDPNGQPWNYSWDNDGNQTSVMDPLSSTTRYTYTSVVLPTGDRKPLLAAEEDARGKVTRYGYDTLGQVVVITDTLNPTTTLTTTFQYDTRGRVTRVTDPLGVVECQEYDSNDNLTATVRNCRPGEPSTNDQNVRTEYGYDVLGRRTWERNALGEVTRTFYATDGRVLKTVVGCALGGVPSTTDCDSFNSATPHLNRTTTYGYGIYGRQVAITDTLGIVTRTDYDNHGRAWRTVQSYRPDLPADASTNVTTTVEYDTLSRVSATVDPLGRSTVLGYDQFGRVVTQIQNYVDGNPLTGDPDADLVTRIEYNAVSLPVTQTVNYVDGGWDPNRPDEDVRTITRYDELDRVTFTIENYVDGVVSSGEVDTDRITEHQYDDVGNLVATIDPAGRVTAFTYDQLNRTVEEVRNCTDGNGLPRTSNCAQGHGVGNDENIRSTMTYTARGEVERQTDPLGRHTLSRYDALGRLVEQVANEAGSVSPTNVTTKYGYDALGHTLVMTDALTGTVRYEYNSAGWLEHQYDQTNIPAHFQYDGLGRRVIQSDALGREAHILHDPLGRPFKQVVNWQNGVPDPNDPPDVDLVIETVYDRASRRVAQVAPDGKRTNYALDGLDRLTSVVENADGLTLPANVTTTYTYDRRGLLKTITDALSRPPRVLSYNAAGWMISSTDPLSRTTSYTYDRVGRQRTVADPRPAVITYTYDLLDRTTGITGPGLTPIAFGYDIGSRRTSMTDATGTTGYTYDGLDRMTQAAHSADGTVNIDYDPLGRRTGLSTDNGMPPLSYSYDAAGRLGEVKKSGGTYASAITDTVGRLQSISRVNGATTTYTYNGADRLTRLRTAVGANTRGDFNYNLSRGSQVNVVTETLGLPTRTVTYGYDGLRRLVSAATSSGGKLQKTYGYEYDLVGNRRSASVNGKKVEQRTYDAADQVVGWQYDGAGNLLDDGSNTYTYDALKQLAQVDRTPGQTYIYTYNGDGVLEREQRTGPFNWIITYFTLDSTGSGALPERLGASVNNGTTSWYMRGWGQELSRENFSGQANTVSWYLPDRLGSVRGEMDSAGGLSNTYNYDPFGTPEGSTTPQDYGFTGEPQTPLLGLVHLRARWYNTSSGRFLTHDPFAGAPTEPKSLHYYMYGYDDPANRIDPTGLRPRGCLSSPPVPRPVAAESHFVFVFGCVTNENFTDNFSGTNPCDDPTPRTFGEFGGALFQRWQDRANVYSTHDRQPPNFSSFASWRKHYQHQVSTYRDFMEAATRLYSTLTQINDNGDIHLWGHSAGVSAIMIYFRMYGYGSWPFSNAVDKRIKSIALIDGPISGVNWDSNVFDWISKHTRVTKGAALQVNVPGSMFHTPCLPGFDCRTADYSSPHRTDDDDIPTPISDPNDLTDRTRQRWHTFSYNALWWTNYEDWFHRNWN